MTTHQILAENAKRIAEQAADAAEYNQHTGVRCCGTRFDFRVNGGLSLRLPLSMKNHPLCVGVSMYGSLDALVDQAIHKSGTVSASDIAELKAKALEELSLERVRHDFEYWAITCATVQDKETKKPISFSLRRPQRRLLATLMDMVERKLPIRIIVLKARQWGGSTLIQIFMFWLQLFHRKGWHSVIIGDVENQARTIRAMLNRVVKFYPREVGTLTLTPFEGSPKNKLLNERECIISIGSMQQPDSLRSTDIAMAHLSEVGLWKETKGKKPEDLIQSIAGTIPMVPLSLCVEESTAKGVGNYFHRSWQAAKRGESGYTPVFVSWFEIEIYSMPFDSDDERAAFAGTLSAYEMELFEMGATLEGIKWYRAKLGEFKGDTWRMQSEFPSTDTEAFQSTGQRVYSPVDIKRMRQTCRKPSFIGDLFGAASSGPNSIKGVRFSEVENGNFWVWVKPDSGRWRNRYVVTVDVGGRWEGADYTCIRVIDRYWLTDGGVPELIATWHGHMDADLAAWKGTQIAAYYGNALLVIESNFLEGRATEREDNHFVTVLDEIKDHYENIYARTDPQRIVEGAPVRYGFHTNRATKTAMVDYNIKTYREGGYVERDERAMDEADTYEKKTNGSYGAVEGCHDDIHMATTIGLYVADSLPMPVEIKERAKPSSSTKKRVATESTF